MHRSFVFTVALTMLFVSASIGQTREDMRKLIEDRSEGVRSTSEQQVFPLPTMDGPVDASEYVVGPGDIFIVSFWTTPPLTYTLPVSPEGFLLVPAVGEVLVADLTLANARRTVLAEIRKKYLSTVAGVTLVQPRQVRITVEGAVRNSGSHIVYATDRIDRVIEMANRTELKTEATALSSRPQGVTQLRAEDLEEKTDPSRDATRRKIQLQRRSGAHLTIDLDRYGVWRSGVDNPYAQEGDVVVVPTTTGLSSSISINGSVNRADRFEFVEGDRIRDLVGMGRGLTGLALADSVVLLRVGRADGPVNLNLRSGSPDWDKLLQPGDRLLIPARSEGLEIRQVRISGAVQTPGQYPIIAGKTRVRDVLSMAGGLLPTASLTAAHIARTINPEATAEREKLLSLRGEGYPVDAYNMAVENEIRIRYELVPLDLVALMERNDSLQNVVLLPDDRIEIPLLTGTVYVFGQVVRPGHVQFRKGNDADTYIALAGGLTTDARDNGIMIIKRSTRQWLDPDETTVEDGDSIWIPRDPDQPWSYYIAQVGQIASVLSVTLTLILLISK